LADRIGVNRSSIDRPDAMSPVPLEFMGNANTRRAFRLIKQPAPSAIWFLQKVRPLLRDYVEIALTDCAKAAYT
jgi:hypothetical protein